MVAQGEEEESCDAKAQVDMHREGGSEFYFLDLLIYFYVYECSCLHAYIQNVCVPGVLIDQKESNPLDLKLHTEGCEPSFEPKSSTRTSVLNH